MTLEKEPFSGRPSSNNQGEGTDGVLFADIMSLLYILKKFVSICVV